MRAGQRIRVRVIAWCTAVVLAVCAVVYFTLSLYLYLSWTMSAHRAALITGSALVLVILVVLAAAYWFTRRRRGRGRRPRDPDDSLEYLLEGRLDPLLRDWIGSHPKGAATGTLLLGIAAGYSRSVRRILQDLYEEAAEAERRRREEGER